MSAYERFRPAYPHRLSVDPELPEQERTLLGSGALPPVALGPPARILAVLGPLMMCLAVILGVSGADTGPTAAVLAAAVGSTGLGAGFAWRDHRASPRSRRRTLLRDRRDRVVGAHDLDPYGASLLARAQRATDAVRGGDRVLRDRADEVTVMYNVEWQVASALRQGAAASEIAPVVERMEAQAGGVVEAAEDHRRARLESGLGYAVGELERLERRSGSLPAPAPDSRSDED
ncbi:hypothetical protein ACFOVU_00070 [Nocardiopsis sediminis]|uniref:SLATT domain-containing protein n=1 Tax=Nocardiopsis sediminis TaxID=1778267 RepID=A0ABV8FHZ3_9ACTN